MTTKEMKTLVATARSYERSQLWMEKVLRMERKLEEMERLGAEGEWLEEQRRLLELQRAQTQYLRVTAREAHERLQQIFGGITDDYIYQLLSRHYLQGHSWLNIARHFGGGNTPDSVRKAASRYLAKLQ